ncbi:MAG: HEAT repeat domain-containing protein, partial [Phycisphaerae bacterium]|nr:HEAT repeat domain-containing protein [Phycisphaerae bacterium]
SALAADPEQSLPKRLGAINALGLTTYKATVGKLIELLKSEKAEIRSRTGRALEGITAITMFGTDDASWANWWEQQRNVSDEDFLRQVVRRRRRQQGRQHARADLLARRMVELLRDVYSRLTPTEKAPLVVKHLSDGLSEVRVLAARQAADIATHLNNGKKLPKSLQAALLARIADTVPAVRAAVADALAISGIPKAGDELFRRLDAETDIAVKSRLARAMGLLGQQKAIPALVQLLEAEEDILAVQSARALGTLGENGASVPDAILPAVKPLEALFGTTSKRAPAVREAACWAIARIARPESIPALIAALDDAAPTVRFNAVRGLGNLGPADETTEQALLKHLADENKAVRTAVADTLSRVGGSQAATALADRVFVEPEADVQKAVWDAVHRLATTSSKPALAEGLSVGFSKRPEPNNQLRAATLIEIAIKKYPADANTDHLVALKKNLVAAY